MKKNLVDVQLLRAIAALGVLIFHIESEILIRETVPAAALFSKAAWVGQAGVDLFFLISGFIMYYVHREDFGRPRSAGRFILRRLVRIVPTYWLLTSVTVLGLVWLPHLFNSRTVDWDWILASYLFIPWRSPAGDISPPVGPGWTLNYEMYFYVIFSIALFLPRQAAIYSISAFFVTAAILGIFKAPDEPVIGLMTSSMLVEFVMGMWLAWAFCKGYELGKKSRWAVFALALVLLAISPALYTSGALQTWWRLVFFGLPAAGLISAILLARASANNGAAESKVEKLFIAIGDSSYALYITHIFTIRIARICFERLYPSMTWPIKFILLFVSAVVVGHLFFILVERPIFRFLKFRVISKKRIAIPA